MCLNFDIHQDEQEDLDKSLILLFQTYKNYCSAESYQKKQKLTEKELKEEFIEDIKFKLDTLDLNAEIKENGN